ncbi:MAG: hypothetical protein RLN63_06005 [Miltoncostaeaceae bacterium]
MTVPAARPASTLAALVAAGVLALGAGHAAALPSTPPAPAQMLMEVADERSGQLEVSGRGRVVISGRVTVQGDLPYRGSLRVSDRAGDAQVFAAGREVPLRRGRAVVRRTEGIVFVSGSRVVIVASGWNIRLWAAGTAAVRLQGTGVRRVNLGAFVPWTRSGFRLSAASRPTAGVRTQARRGSREVLQREAKRAARPAASASRSRS